MPDFFSDIRTTRPDGIVEYQALIGGCWRCVKSKETVPVSNPATGAVFATVPNCSTEDVLAAIEHARHAHSLEEFPPHERLEVMEKAAALLVENGEEMARVITLESGKPIAISRGEVAATAERLKLTMEEARVLYGEFLPGDWVADTRGKFAIVLRKPLGVVAAISPFNYPLFIAAAKVVPALLAGNTVIAKPASETPLALLLFAWILEKAGVPAGSLNVVTGRGAAIGDAIVGHDDVAAVSFTGSTRAGEQIAAKAGIKKLHLELGGKAAAIVLADADLDLAARQVCRGAFRNSGQRCDAVSRLLVERSAKDTLLAKILEETAKYTTGDPLDPATAMGTVINEKAALHIDTLVADAVAKGARIVAGGKRDGLFYPATVLDGVTREMDIAWAEIFGPVLPVIAVDGPEEALALSNESEYGLDSCLFTNDLNKALSLSRRLQDGAVTINAAPAHGVGHFPFGGNKKSGLGREGIKYSIDELTKLHTIIFTAP